MAWVNQDLLIRYLEKKFFKTKKVGRNKGFLEKLGWKKKQSAKKSII